MATKRKRSFNFETVYSFETEEGEELEFEVEANVNQFHPAKLHGAPEDCYPAEGGDCDDWQIKLDGRILTDSEFEAMGGDLSDLREKVEVEASEREPDEPDYDPSDRDYEDDCTDWDDSSRDP